MYNSDLQHILNIFSNERYIELVKVIAKEDRTPAFIRKKLNVTKKDLNTNVVLWVTVESIDAFFEECVKWSKVCLGVAAALES